MANPLVAAKPNWPEGVLVPNTSTNHRRRLREDDQPTAAAYGQVARGVFAIRDRRHRPRRRAPAAARARAVACRGRRPATALDAARPIGMGGWATGGRRPRRRRPRPSKGRPLAALEQRRPTARPPLPVRSHTVRSALYAPLRALFPRGQSCDRQTARCAIVLRSSGVPAPGAFRPYGAYGASRCCRPRLAARTAKGA